MPFKLCIIGAGSVGFTRKLCSDILSVPEFEGIEIALTDISQQNLDMIARILRKMIEVSGLKTKVTATTDRRRALEGATYVMNTVRIGGVEAFATDISIPLKYGVDQCVGDTICAGASFTASVASPPCSTSARTSARSAPPTTSSSTTPTRWQ